MSSVRMCDRCSKIFSELEDGWQTFQATTMKTDAETGAKHPISVAMDACPACAIGTTPRALAEGAQRTQDERDFDARIAALEKETGIAQS